MAVDVGEFANLPHAGGEFARQEFENTLALEFVRDHRGRDVIELPALSSPIQLNRQPDPTLDGLFLLLGFERHVFAAPVAPWDCLRDEPALDALHECAGRAAKKVPVSAATAAAP